MSRIRQMFDGLARDIRRAFRGYVREPAFAAGVVLTFALCIGANATTFGLVNRLMLAPPPGIRDAAHVMHIAVRRTSAEGNGFVASTMSYPMLGTMQSQTRIFRLVAASASDTLAAGRGATTSRAVALGVSGNYFETLGATSALGRMLLPSDESPPNAQNVVVLSHAYWKREFFSDRSAIGRVVTLDDRPFTVVGVAEPGFNGDALGAVDVFTPLSALLSSHGGDWMTNRHMNIVSLVARVRDDVTPLLASQLGAAAMREEAQTSGTDDVLSLQLQPVIPGSESRSTTQGRISVWLAAMSLIVLAVATANIGTLFSLRGARRWRDTSVRIALGATQRSLIQQLLIESMLLSVIGAGVGLMLSGWLSNVVRVTLLPSLAESALLADRRVLFATVGVTALASIVAGLVPAAGLGTLDISHGIRTGSPLGATVRSPRRLALQHALVSLQVALSTVLLVASALFVRSLQRVESQNLGFSTSRLLYATLEFRGFVSAPERDLAYTEAVQRVNGFRGFSATVVAGIPFGPHNIPPVSIPGFQIPPSTQIPIMYGATPDFLRMMHVELTGGRLLTERDGKNAPKVLLVNETLARTAWPGKSAIGKCVRIGFGTLTFDEGVNPADTAPCREVVGVVRDSRARSLRPGGGEDRLMQYYVPFEQLPAAPVADQAQVMGMVIETSGNVDRAAAIAQRIIQSGTSLPAYAHMRQYQDLIDPQLRSWRLGATLFSLFGALAMIIASVGMFGVVSYVVSERTREIGIRLAIGGTRATMARLVIVDVLRMVVPGVVVGLIGSLAAGTLMQSLLFETSPRDPSSLGTALTVLVTAALLAASVPAWRAGRVDPLIALRSEG